MSKPTATLRPQIALPAPSELLGLGTCPADLIAHAAWNEARERAIALVNAGPARIALLGPPGVGKTALLRDLAAMFRGCGRTVCLLYSGDSSIGVGPAEIVLVDEADRISDARLEEYCNRSDIALILAALSSSRKRFVSYPGMSVIRLPLLSPEEACRFVTARLAQLGLPKACLTEAAWAQLITQSRGAPRLLLGVLGLALYIASEEHAACVTGAHVEEAVEARGVSPEAIAAEPIPEELDFAEERLPAVVPGAEGASTETGLILTGGPLHVRRIPPRVVTALYLAAVVALYAAPPAAWLAWSTHRHADKAAAPGREAPAMMLAQTSPAMRAGTEQVGEVAGIRGRSRAPTVELGSSTEGTAAGSPGRGTAGVESPTQPTLPVPAIVARGPDSTAPAAEAGLSRQAAGAASPTQSASLAPAIIAREPDEAGPGHAIAGMESPAQSATRAPAIIARGPDRDARAAEAEPPGHGAAGVESPAQSATRAPAIIARGPDRDARVTEAEPPGHGAAGVASPAQSASPAPAIIAREPDSVARVAEAGSPRHDTADVESRTRSASSAPVVVAREQGSAAPGNIALEGEASATAVVAMANPPSGELSPASAPVPAKHAGVPSSPPLGPMLSEHSPSALNRGATLTNASGGQWSAPAAITERSDLGAKFEHRTIPTSEGHRVQTPSKELSDRFGQASWHGTGAHVQAAQNPHHVIPTVGHQALPPRAAFMQHSTIIHMSLPIRQLLSARQALVESNSSAARGLLEAAQTTIVFEAGTASGRSGIAVGQITNALGLLNSGSTMRALSYLDQAILALQPSS